MMGLELIAWGFLGLVWGGIGLLAVWIWRNER